MVMGFWVNVRVFSVMFLLYLVVISSAVVFLVLFATDSHNHPDIKSQTHLPGVF